MTIATERADQARPWPPLVALGLSFVLLFLIFPNPLRIPNQNPNATAEIAPVPGPPQEDSPQSNFSETGFAESGGLGSAPGGPGGPIELPPPEEVPFNKQCVEGRQTEDPLAPPCVPYFPPDADNGGATWRGVTRDTIKVIFYNDWCMEGDLNKPYKPTDECGSESDFETVNIVKTIKAHLNYFQRRYQTYGRRVLLVGQPSSGGLGTPPEGRRRDAKTADLLHKPFATVFHGQQAQDYFEELATKNVPSFGLNYHVPREYYERNAPYVWSFLPDQETEARWTASFICRTLLGRDGPKDANKRRPPARFSTDPTLNDLPRRIGFVYGEGSSRGPFMEDLAALLIKYVKDECGYTFDALEPYNGAGTQAGSNAPLVIARLKRENITTVICYCYPVPTEQAVSKFQGAATNAQYYPEWFWDSTVFMDSALWHQTLAADASKRHTSLGVSLWWRQPAFRDQYHYQAYLDETKDGSVPNVRFNFSLYHLFLNLFTAIQAAGPILTPETVERGMFTFAYSDPTNWRLPVGSYGLNGPGTYSFIDTAIGWIWDTTGTPPGGRQGEGCLRVMTDGTRYAGEGSGKIAPPWPVGDDAIADARDRGPCTEDTRRIRDPQAGDAFG